MPVALFVRRVGLNLVPINPAARDAVRTLPEGRLMRASVSKPRSAKQHGRVFAALDEAFRNWPEAHEFEPESPEHLRAWMLCRVGHVERPFDEVDVSTGSDPVAIAIEVIERMERAKRRGKWPFARRGRGKIRIYVPATINWEEVDQPAFAPVAQAVFETIELIVGVTVDQLLKERSERARTAAEAAAEELEPA